MASQSLGLWVVAVAVILYSGVQFGQAHQYYRTSYYGSDPSSGEGDEDIKYYTVPVNFYEFLKDARASGTNVTPKIQQNSDGTYTVSIQTNHGTRKLNNISRSLLNIFVTLFQDLSLKVSVVSISGSTVKISAQHEDPFSGFPSYTTGEGSISRDGSPEVKYYTVPSNFYDFLQEARNGPEDLQPKIKTNSDGTYTIIFETAKGTKELKKIDKTLVELFAKLFEDPNLKISIVSKSGSNVKISVTDEPTENSYQVDPQTTVIIKEIKNNPNLKLTNVDKKNGLYVLTFEDGVNPPQTINVPANVGTQIIHFFHYPDDVIHTSPSGKTDFSPLPSSISPVTFNVGQIFLDAYNYIKKHPTSKIKVVPDDKPHTYKLIIIVSGDQKTYRYVKPNLLKVFLTIYKNPDLDFKITPQPDGKYTIVLPENEDKSPKTSAIPSDLIEPLKKALSNPKTTIKISHPKPNDYELIINDGTGDKTFKIPKSLIPVIEKLLKQPRQHDPNIDITKDNKNNPHINLRPGHGKINHPVPDDFIKFINTLKKNPQLAPKITFQIEPRDDGTFDIIVHFDSKTLKFKRLPHKIVQFFINLVNKPENVNFTPLDKTPLHEDETPTFKEPSHQRPTGGRPTDGAPTGLEPAGKPTDQRPTHEKPGKPTKTITTDHPDTDTDDGFPLTIDHPSNRQPSTTTFPQRPTGKIPYKPTDHRPTGGVPTDHRPSGRVPIEEPADGSSDEQPTHRTPTGEPKRPRGEEPSESRPIGTKPTGQRPTGVEPSGGEPSGRRPTHVTPDDDDRRKPKHHDSPTVYTPKQDKPNSLDLLHTIKTAPNLRITVKPNKPDDFDITVDDGVHKTTYPHVPKTTLAGLIKARNNKHLPFEILPSDEPGKANVKIPNGESPEVTSVPVSPDVLDITHELKHDPKTEVKIVPDKDGHFTVTIKNGDKKVPLKHVPSNAVDTIVRLKTDPTLTFRLQPGKKPDTVNLVVPKQQPKPVKAKLTPKILDLIKDLKKKPNEPLEIKPGKKPHTLTIEHGKSPKTYSDIPNDLIPILTKIYTSPKIDIEVKPTKHNTIEFLPFHPKPDVQPIKVPIPVFEIISTIKSNPATTLDIKPKRHNDFTVTTTDDDGTKTYHNIQPNDVRLIVDLQANDHLPFTIKPTTDGVVILVPKTDDNTRKVEIDPTTKKIIDKIRNHPHSRIIIEPDTNRQFTVTIHDKKYTHVKPNLLELIITLLTKPTLKFQIEPESDGSLSVVVPKEVPQTTEVKIPSDKVQIINNLRKQPVKHITLKRDPKGNFNIDVDTPEGKTTLNNLKPKASQFLVGALTNPRLPFHIYAHDNGYQLVLPKRPSEPTFTDVPKDIIDYVLKRAKTPKLSIEITPREDKHDRFDIVFLVDNKPVKKFPDVNLETLEFINYFISHPDTQVKTETNSDGEVIIVLKRRDAPTIDFEIPRNLISLIYYIINSPIKSINVKPGKPDKFDLTIITDDDEKKTYPDLDKPILELILLILTQRNADVRIYIDSQGKFKVALPKGAIPKNFVGIDPDFFNFLKKIQPELPTLSFTIEPHNDDDDFTLDIRTSSHHQTFKFLPDIDIELLIEILKHPNTNFDVKKGPDGDLEIIIVEKVKNEGQNIVFQHVDKKLVHVLNEIRTQPDYSLTVKRGNELSLVIGHGNKGTELKPIDPIVIELFVAAFSDPNAAFTTELGPDGSYTLTLPHYKSNLQFTSLDPSVVKLAKQITSAGTASTLIADDKKEDTYIIGASINGQSALSVKDADYKIVELLILTTVYKDLNLGESRDPDGYLIIDVVLPKIKLTKQTYNIKPIDDLGSFLGTLFGNIITGIKNIAQGAVNVVHDAVHIAGNAVETVGSGIGHIVGGAAKAVGGVGKSLGNLVHGIFSG